MKPSWSSCASARSAWANTPNKGSLRQAESQARRRTQDGFIRGGAGVFAGGAAGGRGQRRSRGRRLGLEAPPVSSGGRPDWACLGVRAVFRSSQSPCPLQLRSPGRNNVHSWGVNFKVV